MLGDGKRGVRETVGMLGTGKTVRGRRLGCWVMGRGVWGEGWDVSGKRDVGKAGGMSLGRGMWGDGWDVIGKRGVRKTDGMSLGRGVWGDGWNIIGKWGVGETGRMWGSGKGAEIVQSVRVQVIDPDRVSAHCVCVCVCVCVRVCMSLCVRTCAARARV